MGDTAASDSRKIDNKQEDTPVETPKDKKDEQPRLKLYIGIGAAAVLILLIAGICFGRRKR